jgi:ABC-type transport system involved in multi-copper enzyme maturation permease subunit
LPLVALTSLLGGIDPTALFGSFLAAIGCAVLSCSLAMMLSVWGRKTQEVLMITYLIIILWLFGPYLLRTIFFATGISSLPFLTNAFWKWFEATNPYFLGYGPYQRPGSVSLMSYVAFLGCCLGISGIFTGLATWRLRAVAQKQADRTPQRKGRGWLGVRLPVLRWQWFIPGPSLDGNPVLWREWYRSQPSKAMRLAWGLYGAVGVMSIVIALQGVFSGSTSIDGTAALNVLQVAVGLLLLCVCAVTSLADERMHGSLDLLLSTPLSTRSILMAKWGGAFRIVPKLLFAPALTSLLFACDSGRWVKYLCFLGLLLAYSAMIVSMGLALATWQSRIGRAAASCIAAYITLSIGWPALVFAMVLGIVRGNDHVIFQLMFGSPLYGTLFGTLGLSGQHRMPGDAVDIWVGLLLWTAIYGSLATVLFELTVATFDRCLGRVPEIDPPDYSGRWSRRMSEFNRPFDDEKGEEPTPSHDPVLLAAACPSLIIAPDECQLTRLAKGVGLVAEWQTRRS